MDEVDANPDLRILPRPEPRRPSTRPGRELPLKDLATGGLAQLLALRLEPIRRNHLYQQGLVEGRKVRVVHNDHRGRVMLRLGNEIFLLGRLETSHIQVRELIEP